MFGGLLINRINEIQRAPSIVALELFGLNPNGKKFCTQVAASGFGEINMTVIAGRWTRHIEIFVEQALRGIGVGVNNDGGAMNLLWGHPAGLSCICALRRGLRREGQRKCEYPSCKSIWDVHESRSSVHRLICAGA